MFRHKFILHIPRLMALLLCLSLVFSCAPSVKADGESGSCGDNLTWTLSAGTLTISGSGEMTNYPESSMSPWYPLREEILRLELPDGLTRIGSLAFYECDNLLAVTIPDSVRTIGDFAFTGCTGMEYLNIGGGVTSIGEYAFSECTRLQALSLPYGLQSIGAKAFYRCESIPSVTIPSSVTRIGMTAFGYCKSLISANIQASISQIPEFLFYECGRLISVTLPDSTSNVSNYCFRGCNQLNTVYYQGSEQTPAQIQNSIGNDVPGFEAGGTVVDSPSTGNVTSTTSQTNNSGSVVQEYVSVSQNSDISISAKAETTNGNSNVDFSVTVQGSEDWDGAQMFIESTLNEIDYDTSGVGSQDKANLNIYISDSNKIDPDFVDAMIERDVKITVTTPNASVWKMQGTSQKAETKSGRYDMRYTLSAGTQELCTELGSQTAFVLQFQESAEVNSEVLIRLGTAWANQQATLFQRGEKGITKVQTVIVDREGYAHFFLASVDKEVLYAIGMHLMTEVTTDIVPEEMLSEYGAAVRYEEIQYEITGRKSSWGVNLGQVMSVLAVVMISAVVVIGFTMYLLNKRRLKNGYIPQWDDEEE